MNTDITSPEYLTTREVAALLRVKERKVYELAAADAIPHRRITGKLLFPAQELRQWIDQGGPADLRPPATDALAAQRPAVISGSHDPLLEWAIRESACGLASLLNGSDSGLDTFEAHQACATGLHLRGADGWNVPELENRKPSQSVLIHWAKRERGLIISRKLGHLTQLADFRGKRQMQRQVGAGATRLWQQLVQEAHMSVEDFASCNTLAHTELDAASSVAADEADFTLGLKSMAQQFDLPFLTLLHEPFDVLVDWRSYFDLPMQTLLRFAQDEHIATKASQLGGYDISELGDVRWCSA